MGYELAPLLNRLGLALYATERGGENLVVTNDSTIYCKSSERGFSAKILSAILIAVMVLAMFQIPSIYAPTVSIFNLQRNGPFISADLRISQSRYFATGYVNGSEISVSGIYNYSSGIEQTIPCVAMEPPSTGQPLRIPECGGGGGLQCWMFCMGNAYSYVSTNRPMCGTPYTSSCVSSYYLYLDNITAINGQSAVVLITILLGFISAILVNPLLIMATALSGVIAYAYATLYSNDMNPDKSFSLWVPYDWTNVENACCSSGFDGATPHFWWSIGTYTYVIQTRH